MAKLIGMKAISAHVNRSEVTVLGWIRDMEFPAVKLGGIWESTTEDVEKWNKKQKVRASGFTRNKKEEKGKKKIETLV